jgi:hypothetical protein
LPEGRQPIGNKWVFVQKQDKKGSVEKHKVRLVAQGFSQRPGLDFSETGTFAPVMRFDTLQTLLAIAAVEDWDIQQLDIKGAYLNGQLKEEVYMRQPTGYEDRTGHVCWLLCTLYGLKQAGNEWNNEFNGTMTQMGYKQLRTNYCTYHIVTKDDFSTIPVWVDNITAFALSPQTNEKMIKKLKEKYEVKVIGEPSMLLGIHVQRNRKQRMITLSQSRYIQKILVRAGMENAKPVSTPMDPNVTLQENAGDEIRNNEGLTQNDYATRIGELLYAAHATRPDILYATVTLARFTHNPGSEHWTALTRVFRYLKGTIDYRLTYGGPVNKSPELTQYVDADWGLNDH